MEGTKTKEIIPKHSYTYFEISKNKAERIDRQPWKHAFFVLPGNEFLDCS